MRVSSAEEKITNTVIGGHDAIDMGIMDSPEFFDVLSNALYTNKPLAIVREVLCNAWDAHIEAGCTDKPLDITLDNAGYLIIRDYGFGIAPDMIGPLYGTYGGTSKIKNANVTGGFGLGCKAPFAVSDTFEVISHHLGKKTIYSCAKSSAERNGKPSITPIVTVPTDETGIGVKVFVGLENYPTYEKYIRQVVAAGEMNARLNTPTVKNEILKIFPFSKAEFPFLYIDKNLLVHGNETSFFVRYGAVIYPIPRDEAFSPYMHSGYSRKWPAKTLGARNGWGLVLQAPPNSIGITPSRENLSMTDSTRNTLVKLFQNHEAIISSIETEKFLKKTTSDYIESLWLNHRQYNFTNPDSHFSSNSEIIKLIAPKKSYRILSNKESLRSFLALQYVGTGNFSHLYNNIGKESFARGIKKNPFVSFITNEHPTNIKRKIQYELLRNGERLARLDLRKTPELLYFRHRYYGEGEFYSWKSKELHVDSIQGLYRRVVILAHNRTDAKNINWPTQRIGSASDHFAVICPRDNQQWLTTVKEWFNKRGWTVLDITDPPRPKEEIQKERIIRAEKTKKLVGIPKLMSCLSNTGNINTANFQNENASRIEKPAFTFKETSKNPRTTLGDLPSKLASQLIYAWGDIGGVVVNAPQQNKWEREGVPSFWKWLADQLDENLKDPIFKEAIQYNLRIQYEITSPKNKYWNLLYTIAHGSNTRFQEAFGFSTKITTRQKIMIDLLIYILKHGRYDTDISLHFSQIKDAIKKVDIHPDILVALEYYQQSLWRHLISLSDFRQCDFSTPQKRLVWKKARKLLFGF